MAKTFIGELILRMKDETSGKAKSAADKIGNSMRQIETAARTMNGTNWGSRFETQMRKIGASARDIDQVRSSWERLQQSLKTNNLGKGMKAGQVAAWKNGVLANFAQVSAAAKEADGHAKRLQDRLRDLGRAGLYALGAGSAVYAGGQALRGGARASSVWEREKFRQSMGNIPDDEKDQLVSASEKLGAEYKSVSITDIAEMARNARSMMGSTKDGLAVLRDMVKGMVTLQTAQTVDVGPETMRNMLRGIDNLGKNGGPQGINDTREIMAGMIRAAQIEGADFDPGKLFEFARRAKIAGPGFSTDFLATTVPAIIQDMTANGGGTSFGTAFQAFVMGSNATNNKDNMAAQMELGIRNKDGLVESKLFGQDPFKWVQSVLRPALQKAGVDLSDDNAVQEAVGKLTKAQMASYSMTRMISQADQVNRNRASYAKAMGPDAADVAATKDPFLAQRGFINSMENLAAAVGEDVMPGIVAGLNSVSGGINTLQQAWRDGNGVAKLGMTGGAALGIAGLWKGVSSILALGTAGPALMGAAASLEAAAISLGAGGVAGKAGAAATGGWTIGAIMSNPGTWAAIASAAAVGAVGLVGRDATAESKKPAYRNYDQGDIQNRDNYARQFGGMAFEGGMHRAGIGAGPMPGVEESAAAGEQIKSNLAVEATPTVNTSSIDAAVAKAQLLLNILKQAGAAAVNVPNTAATNISRGNQSIGRRLNGSFSDQGGQ